MKAYAAEPPAIDPQACSECRGGGFLECECEETRACKRCQGDGLERDARAIAARMGVVQVSRFAAERARRAAALLNALGITAEDMRYVRWGE